MALLEEGVVAGFGEVTLIVQQVEDANGLARYQVYQGLIVL